MALAPVLSFRPAGIRAWAAPGDCMRSTGKGASGGGWWTPLFGGPAELDYINDGSEGGAADAARLGKKKATLESTDRRAGTGAVAVAVGNGSRSRSSVAFTEEKARRLRMMTARTSAFHDAMYHSAIAARLASQFSDHSRGC